MRPTDLPPAEHFSFATGVTAIVCTSGRRAAPVPCCACGQESARLCDYATGNGETCSAPLCDRHTTRDGERDLCPTHRALEALEARVDAEQAPVAFVAPAGRRTWCGPKRARVPEEQLGLPLALQGTKR